MLGTEVRVGLFLAIKQITRSTWWTTSLIVFVMVLTFLNLVVVSGILVGLIQGAVDQQRLQFTSDVIISSLDDKRFIENSPNILRFIETQPLIAAYSARVKESVVLEANYKTRRDGDKPNTAASRAVGIDPIAEHQVTGIASYIIEGEFLAPGDFDKVVVGYYLLSQYLPIESPNFQSLDNVFVGSKIRIRVGDVVREVTVKGIIRSKVNDLSQAVFIDQTQLRNMLGRADGNVNEVAIKLQKGVDPVYVRDLILLHGIGDFAKVQTFEDAQPQFLKDIITTFTMLGAAFSSLGLIVAVITVFIVIFINALTRRKYIGILKGIGISGRAIEFSYVFQSIFYAVTGSIIGLFIVFGFLAPYFASNPINFPFSDGILVAPFSETALRVLLLIVSTIIAGFVPAWMIVRKNTLDSILGRN